jgi:hypothetical protein
MKFKYTYSLLVLYTLLLSACSGLLKKDYPKEGEILFDVEYPNLGSSTMASVYPKEVTVKFKDNNTNSDFTTGMGMVSMVNVANYESKQVIQLLKMITEKKATVYTKAAIDSVMLSESKYTITKIEGETKDIAGYKCKKAKVEIGTDGKLKFDVYYTQEIDAKESNWWSPFKEIDGMLMEYDAIKYGIHMHFTAREVKTVAVDAAVFTMPKDYKTISIAEMDGILTSFK